MQKGIRAQTVWEKLKPGQGEHLLFVDVGRESPYDLSVYNQDVQPLSILEAVVRDQDILLRRPWTVVTHKEWHPDQVLALGVLWTGVPRSLLGDLPYGDGSLLQVIPGVCKKYRSPLHQFYALIHVLREIGQADPRRDLRDRSPSALAAMEALERGLAASQGYEEAEKHDLPGGRILIVTGDRGLASLVESREFGSRYQLIVSHGTAGVQVKLHNSLIGEMKVTMDTIHKKLGVGWAKGKNFLASPKEGVGDLKPETIAEQVVGLFKMF